MCVNKYKYIKVFRTIELKIGINNSRKQAHWIKKIAAI